MIDRTKITRYWKNAIERANMSGNGTVTQEAMIAIVAQCAAREVAARIEARARAGMIVDADEPLGSDE